MRHGIYLCGKRIEQIYVQRRLLSVKESGWEQRVMRFSSGHINVGEKWVASPSENFYDRNIETYLLLIKMRSQ